MLAFLLCWFCGLYLIFLLQKQGLAYVFTKGLSLIRVIVFLSLFLYYYARNNIIAWYIIFVFMFLQIPIRLFSNYGNDLKSLHYILFDIFACIYLLSKYRAYRVYTQDLINKFRGE